MLSGSAPQVRGAICRPHAQRYGERSRQRLDLAVLGFFQSFRRVYVGEQVMHSSKVRECIIIDGAQGSFQSEGLPSCQSYQS